MAPPKSTERPRSPEFPTSPAAFLTPQVAALCEPASFLETLSRATRKNAKKLTGNRLLQSRNNQRLRMYFSKYSTTQKMALKHHKYLIFRSTNRLHTTTTGSCKYNQQETQELQASGTTAILTPTRLLRLDMPATPG
jgi:hypothetical protein